MPNDNQARPSASIVEDGRYSIDLTGPCSHTLVRQPGVGRLSWNGYASVSQLRKPEWWTTEFGRPFSSWPKRLAKLANEAYNVAQAALAQARSFADAEAAITAFTVRFNTLKGIETTEREDLGEAVWQLSQSDHLIGEPIPEEMAQGWFDAARDY